MSTRLKPEMQAGDWYRPPNGTILFHEGVSSPSCHPTRLGEKHLDEGREDGKGLYSRQSAEHRKQDFGDSLGSSEDSRTGIPQEPWTPGLGTENQGRGDRAAWKPGLPGGTTDHEVRREWPSGAQTLRRKERVQGARGLRSY